METLLKTPTHKWTLRRRLGELAFFIALGFTPMLGMAEFLPVAADAASPLSSAELDAVVAEAKQIWKVRHTISPGESLANWKMPLMPAWKTLDRPKLARLLRMPEFAALPDDTKEPLIDQAGIWELMTFDNPSQAQAMWARWYPRRGIDKAITPKQEEVPAYFPVGFHADAQWAAEASAMMALFQCLPLPAWFVQHDDPMLWAMEHHTGWDRPNAFDFGQCVRKQEQHGGAPFPKSPDTAQGMASAAVLENKLSSLLLRHGCSGKGPDRCLPLLHALHSLNPRHERLVAILKKLEPEFLPGEEVTIPEALQGRWGPDTPDHHWGGLSDAERGQVRDIARAALRKVFFLSAKLPVLLDRSAEWPTDELDKTLGVLLKLSVVLKRTEWLNEGRQTNLTLNGGGGYFFADPWRWLRQPETLSPAVGTSLEKWGQEYAKAPGCGLHELQLEGFPPQFWMAYALAKLEQERSSCGALPVTWAARIYAQAMARDQPKSLEPIEGLRKFVGKPGLPTVQSEIVAALGEKNCPPTGQSARRDPWGVCDAWSAHRAAERQRRLAGVWQGTLGTRNIMACMQADGRAAYFYSHVGVELPLEKQGDGWKESSHDAVTGFWTLAEKETDTLQGQWSDPARKRHLPIQLRRVSIAETETPCLGDVYTESLRAASRPAGEPKESSDDASEAEPPSSLNGEIRFFRPSPSGKPWEIEGGYFAAGKWLGLICEGGKCALRPSQLTVTAIRKITRGGTAVPAQRLRWRTDASPTAHAVAFFAADAGLAWLKPHPLTTYYSGKGAISRVPGSGTLEALIPTGAAEPAKLMPMLVGGSPRIAFRVGSQRQILDYFRAAENDINAFRPEAYLLWAGDLDSDGKPDLLLSLNPLATHAALYLSSYAAQGDLVGLAGAFEMPLERQDETEQ